MANIVGNTAYRIITRRTVVRCWNPVDAPLLKEAVDASIEHLKPWMPWAYDEPQPIHQKVKLLRTWRGQFDLDQDYVYGIFSPDETQVLGGTGLHTRIASDSREIGYWIHKDFSGMGLATEITAALVKVAFEIDRIRRVEIHCDPENIKSAVIPRKLGFTHEGTLDQRFFIPNLGFRPSMIWTLFQNAYPGSPAASAEIEAYDAANQRIL